MKCVLVGNYGVGNIGDEALKEYFLSEFPDISWSIVSANPTDSHDIPRLPLGLRSLFTPWWKTISAIRHADALIFGGGSLFTDIESVWARVIWRAYALLASSFKVPVMLSFQGAGPWKTRLGLRLAKKTYESAAFVSVRDADSLQRLSVCRLRHPPVLSFDPAFAFFATCSRAPVGKRLVLIPRANSDKKFFDEAQKKLSEKFSDVRILLMQPDETERRVGERLKSMSTVPASVVELTSVQHLLDEVSAASDVFSQRFHGTLAAFAMGVPARSVPQHAGDKMDTLNERMNDGFARSTLLTTVKIGSDALRLAMRGVSSSLRKALFLVYYLDMHTLHLTKDEQKLFAKLPADLTKDLSVEVETLSYEDNEQRRTIRLKLLKVQDPSLLSFLEGAKKAKDNDAFIEAVKAVDLTKMSSDDLSELFFAIGPDAIGVILHGVLHAAVSRQDLDVAVSLSTIRHGVLEAFSEATSS